MKNKNPKDDSSLSSESTNINDSIHNSSITHFVEQTHSLRTFYLLSGITQIVLGLAVVTVAVLGLIQPQWVSTVLIMIASMNSVIGLYLIYITKTKTYDQNSLLRNAMRRIMQHKN